VLIEADLFPVWNGADATNWSLLQAAIDARVNQQKARTIDQYDSVNLGYTLRSASDYTCGCLAPNGAIYHPPYATNGPILKVDTANDSISFTSPSSP
jgi:hypothetical protein